MKSSSVIIIYQCKHYSTQRTRLRYWASMTKALEAAFIRLERETFSFFRWNNVCFCVIEAADYELSSKANFSFQYIMSAKQTNVARVTLVFGLFLKTIWAIFVNSLWLANIWRRKMFTVSICRFLEVSKPVLASFKCYEFQHLIDQLVFYCPFVKSLSSRSLFEQFAFGFDYSWRRCFSAPRAGYRYFICFCFCVCG